MRRIRHEPSREQDRAFDWLGGFAHEQKPSRGDENEGRECNTGESRDEIGIPVLQLHLISHRYCDELFP